MKVSLEEIEKKLGISGKEQIEAYGVEKFVKQCKESVFTYVKMWEEMTEKVGYWVDMENPYVTYHNDYIESEWWSLSEMHKKGLVYKGHRIVPYCPRCATSLSSHEVAQGYQDVKDRTVFAKFKAEFELENDVFYYYYFSYLCDGRSQVLKATNNEVKKVEKQECLQLELPI